MVWKISHIIGWPGKVDHTRKFKCTTVALVLWYQFILCWLQGKNCCRQGQILKHCFRDELTRIKNSFVKNIHSFSHYISGILIMDPDNFQTSLSSDFNFSNLLTKQLDKKAASSILNITCQRNLTPLHGTHKVKWEILGRKKSKMHFSLVCKKLECFDPKERNRKQMYDQLKRWFNSLRKNSLLSLKFG